MKLINLAGIALAAGLVGTAFSGSLAQAATPTYTQVGTYQFASNTGQPGLANSGDTYWRVSSSPLSYSEASQSLGADGVDLSVTPDAGYADSGIIVPLGTVASSGLLNTDGTLSLPKFTGSADLALNIYFDTNSDGKYFAFNADGVYEGLNGDKFVSTSGSALSAATVTADENTTQLGATKIWAWVGIDASTNGTTVTGNVGSFEGKALVSTTTPPTVPVISGSGDVINKYLNGLDVYRQAGVVNNRIIAFPVTATDPAVQFNTIYLGKDVVFEYAPKGVDTGLCVSMAVGSEPKGSAKTGEVLRGCFTPWEVFKIDTAANGSFQLVNVATGLTVQPNGTRSQFTGVKGSVAAGSYFGWNQAGVPPTA